MKPITEMSLSEGKQYLAEREEGWLRDENLYLAEEDPVVLLMNPRERRMLAGALRDQRSAYQRPHPVGSSRAEMPAGFAGEGAKVSVTKYQLPDEDCDGLFDQMEREIQKWRDRAILMHQTICDMRVEVARLDRSDIAIEKVKAILRRYDQRD